MISMSMALTDSRPARNSVNTSRYGLVNLFSTGGIAGAVGLGRQSRPVAAQVRSARMTLPLPLPRRTSMLRRYAAEHGLPIGE